MASRLTADVIGQKYEVYSNPVCLAVRDIVLRIEEILDQPLRNW